MWAETGALELNESLPCWNSSLPGGNSTLPYWREHGLPVWQTDRTQPCNTLYDVLVEQTMQYLLTVSVASIAGSIAFIICVNRIPRRLWLTVSFFVLAILFVITGCVYYGVNRRPGAPATVAFVAFCHFMFNFGEQPRNSEGIDSIIRIFSYLFLFLFSPFSFLPHLNVARKRFSNTSCQAPTR